MKHSLQEILKRVSFTKLFSYDREKLTNSRRDWNVVLGAFLLLLVGFVSWGVYLFSQIQAGNLFTGTTMQTSVEQPLDKAAIDAALELRRTQKETYDTLLSTSPNLNDPSE